MKAQNTDQRYKDNDSIFTKTQETGFAAAYGPQTNYEALKIDGDDALKMPVGNKYFGYMHSHLDKEGAIKIFSYADVYTFLLKCVRNAKLKGSMSNAYAMVITSQGNYMLKYSGSGGYTLVGQYDKWETWYKKEYDKLIKNDQMTQPNVEKVFTQFLQEAVNISGLEVYKIDKTTGSPTKLEYDGKNNPVKPSPCP